MRIKHQLKWCLLVLLMLAVIFIQWHEPQETTAANDINLVIDGKSINISPPPVIKNDRTLVPVRFVSEELGAEVEWDDENRTVYITKGNRTVLLRIDSRLVEYNIDNEKTFNISDVAPEIIEDRTFVPLRLISNALGVAVSWDDSTRTVYVDSSQYQEIMPFYDMKLSIKPGQAITGMTELGTTFDKSLPKNAAEIRYLLLNPETGLGKVIARGTLFDGKYYWLPDLQDNGEKIIVSAVFDSSGSFLSGDSSLIQVAIIPQIALNSVSQEQIIKDSVALTANINFVASYIKYEITNHDNGNVFTSEEADPQGEYKWTPTLEYNGNTSIKVIAYDNEGNAYYSQPVSVKAEVPRKLNLQGVKSGSTIEQAVTLSSSQNFQVVQTEYVLKDVGSGEETVLSQSVNSGYKWFPSTDLVGAKELYVRVKDTSGNTHTSNAIKINLTGAPKLFIEGIGPNQVVTGQTKLKSSSNTALNSVRYILTNKKTGAQKTIATVSNAQNEYTWIPSGGDSGECKIQAEGTLPSGAKVYSEEISFKVYLGTVYSAKPVIEKDKFLGLITDLATISWQNSGMSAALQSAQAILETGWGQSVPVDKYSGKFSYNLFGIKGTGPAGSVISNTWEEYNGIAFRVDANFRAYSSVPESWADHKKLLLTASRYAPFRAVMHDSTQGAWALRRCGYATDSKYPIKLMNIIKTYDLGKLDEVSI